jgi:hypothetical protein
MYVPILPLWIEISANWEVSGRTASLFPLCEQAPPPYEHHTFEPHAGSPNLKRTIQLKIGEVYKHMYQYSNNVYISVNTFWHWKL